MQPFIYVLYLGPTFNEVFDDIDLVATPCFGSLGVMNDHLVVPFKFNLFVDVMNAPLFM